MIVESGLLLGGAYYLYRKSNRESIAKKKRIANIKNKWSILMDGIGNKAENKIEQKYEMLDIIEKHYGFDSIISIPIGKSFKDVVDMIPKIEVCYSADVMATKSRNTAYIKVHKLDNSISEKESLKFKIYKTFSGLEGCISKSGETLKAENLEEIYSPNKELVGYTISTKLPLGIKYESISNAYSTIVRTLGKCFMDFNHETMQLKITIIHKPLTNDIKFYPIKLKPWELYIGMGHDWKPIILDYSLVGNMLIGGMQGTGKTQAILASTINMCIGATEDFDLFIAMMGEKQDLRLFKDVKQCKYYAKNSAETIKLLKYLTKEMERRNKLFETQNFCLNIYQYNEKVSKEDRLKIIHFISDEIADFMDEDNINALLKPLIRKSRNVGIYISVATQRGSRENMSSEVKGQLGNSVCFYQPNTASALTVSSGEDIAKKIIALEKKREFLCNCQEGERVGKTLYLDLPMMEKLLTPIIEKKHKHINLDNNGNIIEENRSNDLKTSETEQISDKKQNKIIENTSRDERKRNSGRFKSLIGQKRK